MNHAGSNDMRSGRALKLKDAAFKGVVIAFTVGALIVLGSLLFELIKDGFSRISIDFFANYASRFVDRAGIRAPLLGTLWLMGLTAIICVPVGIGAAIWLEEFAPKNRFTQLIETNIANLAGVPSIVYGLLGLGLFVRGLNLGRVILAGALTISLLVLPVVIIAARESIRSIPRGIKEGALALGATPWQAIRREVLPAALPGIATGTILALARAIGETAPLVTLGAFTFIAFDPRTILDPFTVLPIQIYSWVIRPQTEFQEIAATASLVLLVALIIMNGLAIWLRNRYRQDF